MLGQDAGMYAHQIPQGRLFLGDPSNERKNKYRDDEYCQYFAGHDKSLPQVGLASIASPNYSDLLTDGHFELHPDNIVNNLRQ